jgi:hypothetical protein
MKESQGERFCGCIKKVRRTVKATRGTKEQAAIAICVKSVLQTRKRTLKKFTCKNGKPNVQTQSPSEVKAKKRS